MNKIVYFDAIYELDLYAAAKIDLKNIQQK